METVKLAKDKSKICAIVNDRFGTDKECKYIKGKAHVQAGQYTRLEHFNWEIFTLGNKK